MPFWNIYCYHVCLCDGEGGGAVGGNGSHHDSISICSHSRWAITPITTWLGLPNPPPQYIAIGEAPPTIGVAGETLLRGSSTPRIVLNLLASSTIRMNRMDNTLPHTLWRYLCIWVAGAGARGRQRATLHVLDMCMKSQKYIIIYAF